LHRGFTKRKPPRPKPSSPPPEADETSFSSPASTGKILNLARNDVYAVAQRFWEAFVIVTQPLNLILSVVLVWRILGPAALSGIIIVLAGMAINAFLMRLFLRIERVRREFTDTKLQKTSQFVEAIRHLRWYAW